MIQIDRKGLFVLIHCVMSIFWYWTKLLHRKHYQWINPPRKA